MISYNFIKILNRWHQPDGEDGALFHILHGDGDVEDLDMFKNVLKLLNIIADPFHLMI
jgi:hypothetical protein